MKLTLVRVLAAVAGLSAAAAMATPSVTFVMDGNTFNQPFRLSNTSTGGEEIVSFSFDISTVTSPGGAYCFDTVSNIVCNGVVDTALPFTPQGGSAALTGLVGPSNVADGAQQISLAFNHFDAGEQLSWLIDVDQIGNVAAQTVDGNELVGALVEVGFSSGQRLFGRMQLVPNDSNASQFVVTSVVPEPSALSLGLLGLGLVAAARKRR